MEPFTQHNGLVVTLDRANVDTDQIIPKQFLKRIERTGFGDFLFYDWRYTDGAKLVPNADFELNLPQFQGATILVTRRNFGSGSSREHAVWALDNFGIRTVLAPSFADIFYNNCFKNGLLPVVLTEDQIEHIFASVAARPGYRLTVDLQTQTVQDDQGWHATFDVEPARRHRMLNGLDDIAMTLQHESAITDFENRRAG